MHISWDILYLWCSGKLWYPVKQHGEILPGDTTVLHKVINIEWKNCEETRIKTQMKNLYQYCPVEMTLPVWTIEYHTDYVTDKIHEDFLGTQEWFLFLWESNTFHQQLKIAVSRNLKFQTQFLKKRCWYLYSHFVAACLMGYMSTLFSQVLSWCCSIYHNTADYSFSY